MFAAGMKIPEEEEQRNIIDKLANFVARNGPKFEDLTKSKQQDNPKFAFLFGGEHHEYYKWKVSLEATQAEAQKRLQQVKDQKEVPPEQQQAFPNPPPVVVKDEPNEFSLEEFKNLLQKLILVCTKDNIQNGKLWIVSNARTIDEMKLAMQYLLRRMLQEQLPFQQKLHVVYLANDILHYSKKKDMPMLLESLQDYILPIVALAYNGEASDAQEKLLKVLKIWDTQKFFSEEIRQALKTPSHLYDSQLDFIDKQRDEMNKEQSLQAMADQKPIPSIDQIPSHPPPHQPHHDFTQDNFPHGPPGQHGPPGMHGPPPDQFGDPYQQQFDQPWNHPSGGPPGGPDPYHFYGNQYRPPPPQQGFPPFQQGFQEPPGNFEHGGPPPRGFPPFQDGPPPHQVQTFDYSHQSGLPGGIDQPNGGGPVTFDYEHGNAPIPDGAPPIPQHDPTIPMAPYYDLPAGLMVPLVKLWDCEYKPLDPKELRLPIPQPPSERLLAAIEAFYSPPSHDRPRDSQGWEKNGLFEFFKAKLKYIKDKERKLETVERTPSPPPSRASTPEAEGSPLVKERRRSRSRSPSPRGRSPIRGRSPNRRSYSRSRSRSRSRSYSRSRSASPRRSPIRRSPIRRSPTPPSSFLGFQTRSLDSKIEESNVGHQLLKKMGWGGQGLGKKESGIVDPIKAGEVRDNQDKFKGIGVEVNDPFEQYRKTRSYTYGHRSSKR